MSSSASKKRVAKTPRPARGSAPVFSLELSGLEESGISLAPATLKKLFAAAVRRAAAQHRPDAKRLAVDLHVVDDAAIAPLNWKHMKHKGPTDVLSFPMGETDPTRRAFHLGEIVVSFETAQREAAARKLPPTEELARYCVHGFLHLMGYDDASPALRRAMFAVQEAALKDAGF